MHHEVQDSQQLCPLVDFLLLKILQQLHSIILIVDLYNVPIEIINEINN